MTKDQITKILQFATPDDIAEIVGGYYDKNKSWLCDQADDDTAEAVNLLCNARWHQTQHDENEPEASRDAAICRAAEFRV